MKRVGEGIQGRGRNAGRRGQVPVLNHQDAAGPQNPAHLPQAGGRIGQVQQQEAAVHQIEGAGGQAGVAGVGGSKRDVGQAGAPTDFGGLLDLLGAGVNSGDAARGTDHFAEHAGDGAHAAAEIGHVHAGLKAGLEQYAAARRSIDVVQDEEAAYGRRSARQRVFAIAATYGSQYRSLLCSMLIQRVGSSRKCRKGLVKD